jgi:hypothetical protein
MENNPQDVMQFEELDPEENEYHVDVEENIAKIRNAYPIQVIPVVSKIFGDPSEESWRARKALQA